MSGSKIPYADVLAGRDPQRVIAETPARWRALLEGVTAEEADVPTAPGKWSPREIMAHMADCEIAFSWRMRQAYEGAQATIQPFDQEAWAKIYSAYSLEEAKATFFALRTWNVTFVSALTEADKLKPITHPEYGEATLWTKVEIMAGHDLNHLERLEATRLEKVR